MDKYQVCVALDERFGTDDVSVDVRTDQQHPLLKHEVQIATSLHGRAVLVLTFTAVDLWTAILTSMALVRQAVTYQSPSMRARCLADSVRNGWHERHGSTTDSPEDLMTSAEYLESANVSSTSSMWRLLMQWYCAVRPTCRGIPAAAASISWPLRRLQWRI